MSANADLVPAELEAQAHLVEQTTTSQKPRHVHFVKPTSVEAEVMKHDIQRRYAEREMEESIMLRPFYDVLREEFPAQRLESFILWRATENPECIYEWLLCDDGKEGIVRYLRAQMFPIVKEQRFVDWKLLIQSKRPEHLFWSFVCAITLDEGVQKMVESTWTGSQRTLECIMTYFHTRLIELFEAPFDPLNANTIMYGMWKIIRSEVVPMNMRSIVLGGKLKPVVVPLSRNAHRLRKQEMREAEDVEETIMAQEEEDAAAAAEAVAATQGHNVDVPVIMTTEN